MPKRGLTIRSSGPVLGLAFARPSAWPLSSAVRLLKRQPMRTHFIILILSVYMLTACDAYSSFHVGKQNQTRKTIRDYAQHITEYRSKYGFLPKVTVLTDLRIILGDASLPVKDAWGNDLRYVRWKDHMGEHFQLLSPGRDGLMQSAAKHTSGVTPPDDFDADIVCTDDVFTEFPERIEN